MRSGNVNLVPADPSAERDYRAWEALSQTQVKSGSLFRLGEPEPSPAAFAFGAMVDCMAFMPGEFKERFCIGEAVSSTYDRYAEDLTARFSDAGINADEASAGGEGLNLKSDRVCSVLLDYLNEKGLYAAKPAEKRVEELATKAGSLTVRKLREQGKYFVTHEEHDTAVRAISALSTDEEFGWLITGNNAPRSLTASGAEVTIQHQVPIRFRINGVECKALPDILLKVREPNGITTLHVIDLKTTSFSLEKFNRRSFYDFGYDFQLNWYMEAVAQANPGFSSIRSSILLVNRELAYRPTMLTFRRLEDGRQETVARMASAILDYQNAAAGTYGRYFQAGRVGTESDRSFLLDPPVDPFKKE